MIKKLTFLIVCVLLAKPSFAQSSSSSASQTVHIQVAPAIEILTNTLIDILNMLKKKSGAGITWPGGNAKSAGPGGTTADQEIIVRSNKDFIVSVKTLEDNSGNDVMLALVDNRTGGKVNPAFNGQGYAPVGVTSQDLLSNCSFGNERSFAVNYKTKASKETRPTKADVIYTATLP